MEQIVILIALILSIIIHEVAHGHAANWLGDPTARLQGRLTANPLKHIDPLGSVIVPALLYFGHAGFLFGWAKPVPYNPYNLRNQKWGEALVAAAGPAVNILLAVIFSVFLRLAPVLALPDATVGLFYYIVFINVVLALFNLVPIPPLDGSKILPVLLPLSAQQGYRNFISSMQRFGSLGMFAFVFLFIALLSNPFFALVQKVVSLLTGV